MVCLLSLLGAGCASLITDTIDQDDIITDSGATEGFIYAGDIIAEVRDWNWFFLHSPDERRGLLEQKALDQAVELYGEGAVIKPEFLSSRWHPASLLMLFSLAGFVEDARIEASVWLPAPEPEVIPEKIVRYRVIPDADYTTPDEFTTVTYNDRETLEGELKEAFEQGELSEAEYNKKISSLPAGGTVSITYGRSEITNAISRWFTFTLEHAGKRLFQKPGTEDVPYVYGTDRLWWNDLTYKVDTAWDKELLLIVEDDYQKKVYRFRIIREEI